MQTCKVEWELPGGGGAAAAGALHICAGGHWESHFL
jgi:hypothetical protein